MKSQDMSKRLLKPEKLALKIPSIPKQIRSMLTGDESVEKSFDLKGCKVYATSKRLVRQEGRTIRDFDYAHISSVEYSPKRYRWLIALGIILIIAGYYAGQMMGAEEATIALAITGLILIIAGAIAKSERVQVNVVGVSNPIEFRGSGQALDSLMHIIREKQVAEHEVAQRETKDTNFVETIRKLAELRDEGIVTQEEFEEKKRRLLRDSD